MDVIWCKRRGKKHLFVEQLDLQINLYQISHAVNMVNYRITWSSHTESTSKENGDNHIIEKQNKVIILPLEGRVAQ